ncbi:MAG: LysR family transcriptional regulator [Rhodococcus sp.]|nr:LysR family transcriptional regulator [Rhodococcus sp. (in: high G+C Gram-positive bacteria)]
MTDAAKDLPFRLAYVPGVTPTKWVRVWNERIDTRLELISVPADDAADFVRAGQADVSLLRLPIDRTDLSAIPLYTEVSVVVVPKDHVYCAADQILVADLAGEIVLDPLDNPLHWPSPPGERAAERPASTADAIELVAAGVGVVVVPQSLARLHHRKDLTYRPVTDAPESRIALAWREDHTTELVEEFIGIVRGRTANSSRGRTQSPAEKKPARKPAKAPRPAKARSTTRRGGPSRRGRGRRP